MTNSITSRICVPPVSVSFLTLILPLPLPISNSIKFGENLFSWTKISVFDSTDSCNPFRPDSRVVWLKSGSKVREGIHSFFSDLNFLSVLLPLLAFSELFSLWYIFLWLFKEMIILPTRCAGLGWLNLACDTHFGFTKCFKPFPALQTTQVFHSPNLYRWQRNLVAIF